MRVGRASLENVRHIHIHDVARPNRELHYVPSSIASEMSAESHVPLERIQSLDPGSGALLDGEDRGKGGSGLQRVDEVRACGGELRVLLDGVKRPSRTVPKCNTHDHRTAGGHDEAKRENDGLA